MEENQTLNIVGSAGSTVLDITEETESCSHAAQPSQVSMQAYQQHSGYLFGKNTHLVMDYHTSTSSVTDTQQYCNSPITWTTPSTHTATINNCSQSYNQTSFQQTELTISQNVEAKQQFTQSPAPDIITSSPYPISPISSHFPTLDTDSLFPELSSVLFFTSPTSSQSPSLLTPHPCSISPSSSQCSTLFPSPSWQTSQTSSPGPVLQTPSACPISSASSPIFSSFSSSPVLLIPEKINNPHVVHNQSSLDQQAKITFQNCEQSSQLSQPMQSSISRLGNTNTINSITSSLKQEDILSKRRDCAQQIQLMQDTSVSQMHQKDLQFAHFNSQGYQHSNKIQQNTSLWEHQNPQSVQCSLQTNRQNSQGHQQTQQITQQNYLGSQQDLPENPHMFQQNAQDYTQSQQKPPDLINFHQQPQQTLENHQQISWQSQNSHNNQPNNCQNLQTRLQNSLVPQQNIQTNQQNTWHHQHNFLSDQHYLCQPQLNLQISQQTTLQPQENFQTNLQNPNQPAQTQQINEQNTFQPQQNTMQPQKNLLTNQHTLWTCQQNPFQPEQNFQEGIQRNLYQSQQNNQINKQNTLQPHPNIQINQQNALLSQQNVWTNQQNLYQLEQNLQTIQQNPFQPQQNEQINQQNALQFQQNLQITQQNPHQLEQNILTNEKNEFQPLQNLHNQQNTLQPLQNLHNQPNTLQPLQNLHNQQNTLQPLQNLHIDQQNTLQLQQNLLTNQQNPWQPQHNIESNQQNAWQIQQNLKTDQQNTPQLQQSFLTHEEDPYQLVQNLPANQQKPFQPEQNTQGQQNMWSSQILQTNQPYSTARLNLQTNQPYSTARLNLQTNQPCSTARLNLQTNQPCSTARLNLQTNQHNILKAIQKSEHTRQQQSQHCMHPYNQESGRELSIQQTQTASNLHPLDRDTSLNCAAASISHQSRKVKKQMSSQMLSEHAVQTGHPTSSSCTELLNFLIRNQETAVEEETMQIPSQFSCWVGVFITQQLFPCLQSLVNINYMDIENNQMYSQFLQELSTLGQLAATDLKKLQKKERQHKGKLTDKANDCGASSRNLMEIGQDMPAEEEQLVCQENNWDNLIKSADICHQKVKELASNIQEMAGKWFEYIINLSQQICELRTLSHKFKKVNLPNPEENLTTEMNEKSGCCILLQCLSDVCGRLIDFMEKWRCLEAWKYVQLTPTPDYMIVKTRYNEFGAMYTTYFHCLSIVESRIVRLQEILLDAGVKSNLCAAKLELYKIKFKLLSVSWFYKTQPPTCCLQKDKMNLYIRLFGVTHSDIDEEKSEIYVFPQANYEKRMDKEYLCKESLKYKKCQSGNAARKQKVGVVVSILPSISCKRRSESLCFEQMHRICLVIQLKPNLGQDIGPKIECCSLPFVLRTGSGQLWEFTGAVLWYCYFEHNLYKLSPTFTKTSTIDQVVHMLQAVIGTRDPERILDKHEILSLKSLLKSVSDSDEISLKQFAKDPFNLHGKQVTEQGKQPTKQRKQSIKQGKTPTIERKQGRKSNGEGEQPSDTSKKFSFFTWFMAAVNSYMFLKSCKMSGNWFFLNNELCPAARDVPDGSALIRASRSCIEEPGGENPYAYLTVHIYSGDRSDLMRVAIKSKFNAKPQAFVDWLKLVTDKNKVQMIRTILPQKTPLEEFKDSSNEEEQTNNYRTRYKELPSTTIIIQQQFEEMSLYADSDLSHLAE